MPETEKLKVMTFGPYRPMVAYCDLPCQGVYPCILLCSIHHPNEVYDRFQGHSINLTDRVMDNLTVTHSKIFESMNLKNITSKNVINYDPKCRDGEQSHLLDPCSNSQKAFNLQETKEKSSSVHVTQTGETYNDYCMIMYQDVSYGALVCKPKTDHASKEW